MLAVARFCHYVALLAQEIAQVVENGSIIFNKDPSRHGTGEKPGKCLPGFATPKSISFPVFSK